MKRIMHENKTRLPSVNAETEKINELLIHDKQNHVIKPTNLWGSEISQW